ncbi:hypothetical protein FS837_003482, partial [Tulasnella sp. UAMH 9824]
MSPYRIEPTRIKTADTAPRARGGQGVVIVGTLLPPKALEGLRPEAVVEKLFRDGYYYNESPHREIVPEDFKKSFPEEFKEELSDAVERLLHERKVAIKTFEWPSDDAENSAKFFKSFVNELSLMASLAHPNIIEFLGFVEDITEGDARIIIPWEENGNVRDFLQSGEWDIPERISLIRDTARGLEYLHNRDPPICHGDLKSVSPPVGLFNFVLTSAMIQLNILVNSSFRAVITDFGSARIRRSVPSETGENHLERPYQALASNDVAAELIPPKVEFDPSSLSFTLTGPAYTLRWTAPEVLDDGVQDLPSDMWAMGWICWE